MPGVAVRTAAVLLVTVGDATSFPSAAHLAFYAGLAPTTKSSGTSIHGEHAPRGGNRQLKRPHSPPCTIPPPAHAGPSPSGPPPHQRAVRHALRRHLQTAPHDLLILDEGHRGPPATRLSRGHPTRQQPGGFCRSTQLRRTPVAYRCPRQIMKSTFFLSGDQPGHVGLRLQQRQ